MKSSFVEFDNNLTTIIKDKQIARVEHIDNDLCIKISFTDKSYIVVDTMHAGEGKYFPLFYLYDEGNVPVNYQS